MLTVGGAEQPAEHVAGLAPAAATRSPSWRRAARPARRLRFELDAEDAVDESSEVDDVVDRACPFSGGRRRVGLTPLHWIGAMKTEIHPEYVEAHVRCTCGNEFTTRSTQSEIHVEICSNCHPFYTGRQKLVDTGGRVERFKRRAAKRGARS